MKEDSFLKKFKGRMEQIGKNGYTEILKNLHINIVDYIPKPVKVKKPKTKVDKYGHIQSEVSEEFNKNVNYMPQNKNIALSPKRNKSQEIEKININNIKSNKINNMNKFNIKNNIEGNKNKTKEKGKEKPIKLLKNIINNNGSDNKNNRDNKKMNSKDNKSNIISNIKNYLSSKNNNKLIETKKKSNSIKLNLKLPPISQIPSSPKKDKNNKIINNSNNKVNKSHERTATYTPKLKDIDFSNSQVINDNLKRSYNKRLNSENGKLKNLVVNKESNLPKISKKLNNIINTENDNNIKLFNKQKNEILTNIKNDFLMLDAIKNRANNAEKDKLKENNNFYKNKNNNINQENQINNNNINNGQNSNNIKHKFLLYANKPKINVSQNGSYIKNSRNYFPNNIFNINENSNTNSKEDITFGTNEGKKPHTSFDYAQNIPKIKDKLDIIHEESEDDNKYITDVVFNNSFENKEKLSSLEILMRQRANFQNKIPNNSRFKLK